MFGIDFNEYQQEERKFWIPAGTYFLEIKSVENTVSKKGNEMVLVTYTVKGGDHKYHEIRDYFLLHNSGTAGEIAKQRFAKLLRAVDKVNAASPDELIDCQFNGVVALKSFDGKNKNQVVGFIKIDATETDDVPF